jgi:hypothetical protein
LIKYFPSLEKAWIAAESLRHSPNIPEGCNKIEQILYAIQPYAVKLRWPALCMCFLEVKVAENTFVDTSRGEDSCFALSPNSCFARTHFGVACLFSESISIM